MGMPKVSGQKWQPTFGIITRSVPTQQRCADGRTRYSRSGNEVLLVARRPDRSAIVGLYQPGAVVR